MYSKGEIHIIIAEAGRCRWLFHLDKEGFYIPGNIRGNSLIVNYSRLKSFGDQ